MTKLYSGMARSRPGVRVLPRRESAECGDRLNWSFWDALRHFAMLTVAKRRQFRIPGISALAVLAAFALAGCAGMARLSADSSPEAKREAVTARAEARWQALLKGDLDAAYQYLSPGSKAAISLAAYKATHNTSIYRAAKVDKVTCEGAACKAILTIRYDYQRFKGVETRLTEQWVIEGGQAWILVRR